MEGMVPGKQIIRLDSNNESIFIASLVNFYKLLSTDVDVILERRRWLHKNPLGSLLEYILFENNEILAYNFFIPTIIENNVYLLSGGSHVNPSHKGAFVSFYLELLEILRDSNYKLVFGFPNKNSYPIMMHKFGANMKENKNYKQIKIIGVKKRVSKLEKIEVNFDIKKDDFIINPWNKWKLDKPHNNYQFSKIEGKILIYKIFENQIDLISIPTFDSYEEYVCILQKFYVKINKKDKHINLIISSKRLFQLIDSSFEMKYDDYERHLCYKYLKNYDFKFDEFSVEMIHSDIY